MNSRILLLIGLLMAAACTGGRNAAPELPIPLASALMDQMGSRAAPTYTVDALPAEYPASLRPGGHVTVVGGMTFGNEVVGVFADSAPVAPILEQQLERTGFHRPPARPGTGFMGASGGGSYCKDSTVATVTQLTGTNRNMAKLSLRNLRSPCTRMFEPEQPSPRLRIPVLTPPTGVHVPNAGGGGSDDGVDARAEMTGVNLVPRTILAHYAAQLTAAGWKGDPPAVSDRVAAQFFEARSEAGQTWLGTMTVTGSGSALKLSIVMRPR